MRQPDQTGRTKAAEEQEKAETQESAEHIPERAENALSGEIEGREETTVDKEKLDVGFDWLAMGIVILIAALFALTARFNSQPSPSFVPSAALSATGCGLLVTALRKLRTSTGVGLFEAALGGFFLALFQFAIALTYPEVFATIMTAPAGGHAFLLTWGLIGLFSTVLSVAGATLGHLIFAPLRTLPERARQSVSAEDLEVDVEAEDGAGVQDETAGSTEGAIVSKSDEVVEATETEESEEEAEESLPVATVGAQRRHLLVNYAISIALLGLLPMIVGYVFAASYDFMMGVIHADQISPALYPTLSLLSGLLPWRLQAPIALTGANGPFIVFTLLWRIPDSFLGNPNMFDVQTLEPLLLNATALALLLITMYGRESRKSQPRAVPWGIFIFLEVLLGLFLIFPPDLWMLRGLEGVLQLKGTAVSLPTVHFLNATLFTLNLVTGPLFCLLVGLVVRRQHQLWSVPRQDKPTSSEA